MMPARVIEPKLLKAFVWNELGVVHFEEKSDEGNIYDSWTIFKLDNPSEYNGRTDDTGMGGDYGWYDWLETPSADAEYIGAGNECGDSVRIYPDGDILDDEFEDDEDDEDWDDEDDDEVKYKYGFIDKTGAWIVEPKFDKAYNFSNGVAMVKLDGKWGFIDKAGAWIVEPKFDNAYDFSDGAAKVEVDGKYGFIDKTGAWIVEPKFDNAYDFSDGAAKVKMAVK